MRIPICLRGERAGSMHFVKSTGSQRQTKGKDRVLLSHSLEGESQESPVMGGYLDVKVCVFQVQRKEPVPCANLREDLLQRDQDEWPPHESVIQVSEIEDGPEAAILFGDEEIARKCCCTSSLALNRGGRIFHSPSSLIFPACSPVLSDLLRDSLCTALQTEKLWIWSTGLSTLLTPSSRQEAWVPGNLSALTERSQLATRWTRGGGGESCV